jgi:hypothetical protein
MARETDATGTERPGRVAVGDPRYEDFLYAAVSEQQNGMTVSVLSLFARRGVDPWSEAARLSGLPAEAANRALVRMISQPPEGAGLPCDAAATASRLLERLPGPGRRAPRPAAADAGAPAVADGNRSVFYVLIAAAVVAALSLWWLNGAP